MHQYGVALRILWSKADSNTWESFTRSELKLEWVHQELPRSDIFRKRATKPLVIKKHHQKHLTWPIKHSNTMVIEPAFGTFGSVGRCQVLLEKEISNLSAYQQKEAWSALKCPSRWLHWLWTSENTVDQHQQMTRQPKSSLTEETSLWTSSNMDSVPLHSSSRLWDLDFQMKSKMYFIWKEDFGLLSNNPVR